MQKNSERKMHFKSRDIGENDNVPRLIETFGISLGWASIDIIKACLYNAKKDATGSKHHLF